MAEADFDLIEVVLRNAVSGESLHCIEARSSWPVERFRQEVGSLLGRSAIGLSLLCDGQLLQTCETLKVVGLHGQPVIDVLFQCIGEVVTGSLDGTAKTWSGTTGECLVSLSGHVAAVHSVAFAPDGTSIATGSADGTAKFWNLATGECIFTLESWHKALGVTINSVAFSHCGGYIVTGSSSGVVTLWDALCGNPLCTYPHEGSVVLVAFSMNVCVLTCDELDGLIFGTVWQRTGEALRTIRIPTNGYLSSADFSSDGRFMAVATQEVIIWTLKVWSMETGLQVWEFGLADGDCVPSARPIRVALSADGHLLAVRHWGKVDAFLHVYTVRSSASANSYECLDAEKCGAIVLGQDSEDFCPRLTSSCVSLAFSSDGRYISSGLEDGSTLIWNVDTRSCTATLVGHDGSVSSTAIKST